MVGQQFTSIEREFMVESYLSTHNILQTIQSFHQQFPNKEAPSKSTILRNVAKYRMHGTSKNLNRGTQGDQEQQEIIGISSLFRMPFG